MSKYCHADVRLELCFFINCRNEDCKNFVSNRSVGAKNDKGCSSRLSVLCFTIINYKISKLIIQKNIVIFFILAYVRLLQVQTAAD